MYCVVWTYAVPPSLDETAIRRQFAAVADRYIGIPGLIRKYFGLSEDGGPSSASISGHRRRPLTPSTRRTGLRA